MDAMTMSYPVDKPDGRPQSDQLATLLDLHADPTHRKVEAKPANRPVVVERKIDVVVDTEPFNGGTNINGALLNAADYVEREGRPKMRTAAAECVCRKP
jgi:hypothetical protein